jgi:hypothetical protein
MAITLLALHLLGTLGNLSGEVIRPDTAEAVVVDTVQVVSIGPGISPLSVQVELIGTEGIFARALSIVVLRSVANSGLCDTVQVISESAENGYNAYLSEPENAVTFQDINFDGYTDLMYVCNVGNQGVNQDYAIWLFNKHLKRFEYSKEFSETIGCNPIIDATAQSITTSGLAGCLGDCYSTEVYEVQNNHLILVDEESQELDPEGRDKNGEPLFVYVHRKRIRGTMVTVTEVFGTLAELEKYH